MMILLGFAMVIAVMGAGTWVVLVLEKTGRKGGVWSFLGFGLGTVCALAPLLIWGLVIDPDVINRDRPVEWAISTAAGLLLVFGVTRLIARLPVRAASGVTSPSGRSDA